MQQNRIEIYDPNDLNPYGYELACLIATALPASRVTLIAPKHRDLPPHAKTTVKFYLSSRSDPRLLKILRRLIGPLRASFGIGKNPLVIVWTRDVYDALVFALRALIGLPTYFIYHNPPGTRTRAGFSGWAERILAKSAIVCVHNSWVLESLQGDFPNARLTPHPPYAASLAVPAVPTASHKDNHRPVPKVAFIGALRPDKGGDTLPTIANMTKQPWKLMVLGADILSPNIIHQLADENVEVQHPFSGVAPSDHELHTELVDCDLVIAPYSAVTESGSLILAQSLNVPAVALYSPALEGTLSARSMAPTPSRLGSLLEDFLSKPWPTFVCTAEERALNSAAAWKNIISNVQ